MKILKILITGTRLEADLDIHLSNLYQFFIFTITNVSGPYAVCGSIIVMCMLATALRNLIYKVLNLAILSVFVVALWAYLTDVTFIYVVYILTFVSAVVMLFLSVVLMLPSSAIAVTKRNFSFVLLTATASTSETSIVSTIVSTAICIVTLSLTLLAVYIVVAYIKSWKNRLTYIRHGHPRTLVSLTRLPYLMQNPSALPEYYDHAVQRGLRFAKAYYLYVYDQAAPNSHAVLDCKSSVVGNANFGTIKERWRGYDRAAYYSERGQKPVLITSLNVLVPRRFPFPVPFRFGYPIYIRAVPRIVKDVTRGQAHHIRRLLGMVIYEFINFYVYRLEPNFLKVGGFKLYNKIMRPIRAYANAGDDWLARYCYTSGGRAPILFYAAGDFKQPVYLSIYTPWWSPFRVFNGSESIIGRIMRNLYRRLRFHLTRRPPSKPTGTTAVNSYIPPAVSNTISSYILRLFSRLVAAVPSVVRDPISKYVRHFYNSVIRVINRIPDTLRIHPAVVLRLSDLKGNRALAAWYGISGWYFRCINFIFTNIELPLSSKTSAKSGFAVFKQYYDFLAPTHGLSIPIGYNVTWGVYTPNSVRRNKLIFLKNFLIFMIINLGYNVSIAVTYAVIFLTLPSTLEIVAQVITTFSVFFIAVPVGITGTWAAFTYSSYLIDACTSNLLENLAAIQHGLYVSQPLLLLVSITGLLVALIGAPFFISRSN